MHREDAKSFHLDDGDPIPMRFHSTRNRDHGDDTKSKVEPESNGKQPNAPPESNDEQSRPEPDSNEKQSKPGHESYEKQSKYEPAAEASTHDRRGRYAKQLQRASKDALQRVKQNTLLVNSGWAEPLTAAPAAISVLAFIMKTAASKKVAGLPVSSRDVFDEKGIEKVGKLPSPYFHTNLLHCSDLGRSAFLEAQKRMSKINSTAFSLMEDGGQLGYLIELLEDPEDAKRNLKPAMQELKAQAEKCGHEVAHIQKKFEYWHLVINHLGTNALDILAKTVEEQSKVGDEKADAEKDERKYDDEKAKAVVEIKEIEQQLNMASDRVSRAQDELDRILSMPPIMEQSYFADAREASLLAPSTAVPEYGHGFVKKGYAWAFGATDSMRRSEEEHANSHRMRQKAAQDEYLEKERARRERLKSEARERLAEARSNEAKLCGEYDRVAKYLSDSHQRLCDAKHNLAKASSDLKRLGNRELELDEIMSILQESTQKLGMLKNQLARLVIFFSTVETIIAKKALGDVESFLRKIETNADVQGDEVHGLDLRGATKRTVLATALQIQGQFSSIADISSAYVKISDSCILPAISKMEQLALTKDENWDVESEKFNEWCEQAISDIDAVFRGTQDNMGPNMARRIGMLSTLAIEAARENEEFDDAP
ncbi:hypothetical protein FB567DRAFT_333287 [Paraphoma chrysanthemicola]|uniref:Uncharacterized protein n=1 Tax=Paraphoma chrysanthemicola TaxID=798071 RepID=A0A8K0R7G9_9PLEO|nr:hypothetical protein FB567DRAFT_333287 [Paraphoma chrysanthemicola]